MKTITTLRNHLFDQLERLAQANTTEEINIETEKAIHMVSVSDAILRTAEVEAAYIGLTNKEGTGFISIDQNNNENQLPATNKIEYFDDEYADEHDKIPEDNSGNYLTEEKRSGRLKKKQQNRA